MIIRFACRAEIYQKEEGRKERVPRVRGARAGGGGSLYRTQSLFSHIILSFFIMFRSRFDLLL